eukprot:CAMPEP_0206523544 /NCGR_PEP_ID=MMETSP0324_2-20121206/67678_1 /ASSEMBLY_ACC=CAM_ASM_000836 /TAXON_ID=2866 /ORGANISM="Crypthecodinium cohnii, Strain Seligo" /LENGTH=78 /DNA_ID=CAMNT_0054017993 /DNA_START=232 /DNA_END=468 /DNA_ORIENTATION=-
MKEDRPRRPWCPPVEGCLPREFCREGVEAVSRKAEVPKTASARRLKVEDRKVVAMTEGARARLRQTGHTCTSSQVSQT